MKVFPVLAALLVSWNAHAAVLDLKPSAEAIEEVALAASATANVDSAVPVALLGAGIRKKKVAIVKVKVYVAQLFGSDANSYVRTEEGALGSLDGMKAAGIRMNFVRDVSAEKIANSFQEGFDENGVPKSEATDKFLAAVNAAGEVKEGQAITIVGERAADGKETLAYEDQAGKVTKISGGKGLIHSVLAIWLGKMDDGGLEDLRESLIKGR